MLSIKQTSLTRRQRFLHMCLSMLIVLAAMLSLTVQASAANISFSVQDIYQLTAFVEANPDLKNGTTNFRNSKGSPIKYNEISTYKDAIKDPVSWSVIKGMASATGDKMPDATSQSTAYRYCMLARSIANTFGDSEAKYKNAVKNFSSVYTYDAATDTLGYQMGKESQGSTLEASFAGDVASAQASTTFREIYDMRDWNPQAGVAGQALASVYSVVNTVFYVCSQLIMWFFILQTGFDVFYLVFEPIRPFIGPKDGNGGPGMSGNNGTKSLADRIHIPIASHAAAEAANAQVGLSGGGMGGGTGTSGNPFFTYAIKRFPVVLLCTIYIILVANGYWIKVIEWISGFVVKIISGIMSIGK